MRVNVHRPLSPGELLGLAAALRDLAGWPPVGGILETARGAVAGHDALGVADLDRLRRWATRWRRLDPRLRAVYVRHAPTHETASVALYRVLDGGPPLEGWQRWRVRELWAATHGSEPGIEVCPVPSERGRR